MAVNVGKEIASGAKWNAIGHFGNQFVAFFVSIILARLLAPEEFGLIAMLTIFMEVAKVFISSGLGTALIQKKNCTEEDYSTVFYFNIVVSAFFYLLLFFFAPLIANFYQEPELKGLTRWISLVFLINSIGMVQTTLLAKRLNFRRSNLIAMIGVAVSAVVAVFMAYKDFGVYALVGQSITYALVSNVLYWILSDWRPLLLFSKKSFKELFGFGSKLLIANLSDKVYCSLDSLLIGKIFSPATLGFYTRAKTTKDLPINNTTNLITSTLLPVFSKIDSDEHLANVTLKMYQLVFYIVFPAMIGLILVAEPFVETLYSAKWLPSVPWLQIICCGGVVYPLSVVLCQTIVAKGRSGMFLKLEILKKIIGLFAMIVGLLIDVTAFLWASVISSYLCLLLNVYYATKVVKIPVKKYFTSLVPTLGISFLMGILVYGVGCLPFTIPWLKLTVMALSGLLIYLACSKWFKIQDYLYLKQLILDRLAAKKKQKKAENN